MSNEQKIIKDYNVWSNFTYFIAGLYAIVLSFAMGGIGFVYKVMFLILGLALMAIGIISCVYHTQTPSYKQDVNQKTTKEYIALSSMDTYLALAIVLYSFIFFLVRLVVIGPRTIIIDPIFYFTILFGVISIVFYCIAREHDDRAIEQCKTRECIQENHDAYDIFHSNWHLFTGVALLFGITLLKHTFDAQTRAR